MRGEEVSLLVLWELNSTKHTFFSLLHPIPFTHLSPSEMSDEERLTTMFYVSHVRDRSRHHQSRVFQKIGGFINKRRAGAEATGVCALNLA